MKRALTSVLTSLLVSASLAATNLVSNTATVTNRTQAIVTYTMSNGVARVKDPSGRLVGTAEEVALTTAAQGQLEIASAAANAAGTAREEWEDFMATNDSHVVYIAADFAQDLPALAPNFAGWVASSRYDGTNDHYYIWFNRELAAPPSMCARISHTGGTNWLYGTWKDWNEVKYIDPKTGKPWTKPYGARVSYLEGHGTEWIDLGKVPNNTWSVELKIMFVAKSLNVFGSRTSASESNVSIIFTDYTNFDFGDYIRTRMSIKYPDPGPILICRTSAAIRSLTLEDGTVLGKDERLYSGSFQGQYSAYLFDCNNRSSPIKMIGRIYYCKIVGNDGVDLIPVLDLLGRPAMYDQVSGQFFYNQGTGRFAYGPILDASVTCRELVVPRRNADCVLKTGSIITLGGESGFDADANRVTVRIGDVPSVTTALQLPRFYTRQAVGTNTVTTAYTNAFLNVENGFFKEPTNE